MWSAPDFADAIRQASPGLADRVDAVRAVRAVQVRQVRRATVATVGYLLRSISRPTPFGLFAGVAPVSVGPTARVRWGQAHRPATWVDTQWLADVIERLEACPELLERLDVVFTNLATRRGGRLEVPHGQNRVTIRYTSAVQAAREAAACPIRWGSASCVGSPAGYRERGWLRLAAVHHNVVRGAVLNDENLRDADDLDRWLGLGQPGAVNLILHGHTHDGQVHRLPSGLIALSTGSAAVPAEARPGGVPNQYQLVTIRSDGLTRHARQYAPGQRRWIGDTCISHGGSAWRARERHPLADVGAAFGTGEPDPGDRPGIDRAAAIGADRKPADGFFDRILEATRVAHPHATVTPAWNAGIR